MYNSTLSCDSRIIIKSSAIILDQIQTPVDIKSLSIDELNTLAEEIKVFLIESIEKT